MFRNNLNAGIVAIIFALMFALTVSAQTNPQNRDRVTGTSRKQTRQASSQEPGQESADKPSSVRLVEGPRADYLSGEANVAVSGNQNPVIRLGLSPNGATIIEFPAADKLFNIIPGNSNLVTVEESPTKATDRFIIARPGDGFASPATMANARRAPATSVMVQMQSGLVITFLFYPVPELSEQAHRVVVTYDRNEVIAARRAAGLAVNLDSATEVDKPRTTSTRIPPAPASTVPAPAPENETPARVRTKPTTRNVADVADIDTSQPPEKHSGKGNDPARAASLALTEATKSPKDFKKWNNTVHGLSLSVSPVKEVSKKWHVVVVAAKNVKNTDARIVPGQPGIYLETLDSKGKPLQIESIKTLATETTVTDDVIPGDSIGYYAVVFEAPIMGARQRLKIGVGQTVAADEPATATLTTRR
jgi:hypothetical protein